MTGAQSSTVDLTRPGLPSFDEEIRAAGRKAIAGRLMANGGRSTRLMKQITSDLLRLLNVKTLDRADDMSELIVVAASRDDLMRATMEMARRNSSLEGRPVMLSAEWCAAAPERLARSLGFRTKTFEVGRARNQTAPDVVATLAGTGDRLVYLESPDALGCIYPPKQLAQLTDTKRMRAVRRAAADHGDKAQPRRSAVLLVDQTAAVFGGHHSRTIDETYLQNFDDWVPVFAKTPPDTAERTISFVDLGRLPGCDRPPSAAVAICSDAATAKWLRAECEKTKPIDSASLEDAAVFLAGLHEVVPGLRRVMAANTASFNERILRDGASTDLDDARFREFGLFDATIGPRLALPVADFMPSAWADSTGSTISQRALGQLVRDCFRRSGVSVSLEHASHQSALVFDAVQDPDVFLEAVSRLGKLLKAPNGLYNAIDQQPNATITALRTGHFEENIMTESSLELDDLSLVPSGYEGPFGMSPRVAMVDGHAIDRGRQMLGGLVHERSEESYLQAATRPLCDLLGLAETSEDQVAVVSGVESVESVLRQSLGISASQIRSVEDYRFDRTGPGIGSITRRSPRLMNGDHLDVDALMSTIRSSHRAVIINDPARLMGPSLSSDDLLRLHRRCKELDILLVIDRSRDVGAVGFEERNQWVLDNLVAGGNCALFCDTGPFVAPARRGMNHRRLGVWVFPDRATAEVARSVKRPSRREDSSHAFDSLALIRAAMTDRDGFFSRARGELARHLPLLHRMGRIETPRRIRTLHRKVDYGSTPTRQPLHGIGGQKRMLIVGGGIAGIAVGLEAIARGIPVTIVDDSPPGWNGKVNSGISVAAAAQFLPFIYSTDRKLRERIAQRVAVSRITFDVLGAQPAKTGVLPIANVEMLLDGDRWAIEIEQAMRTGRIRLDEPLDALDLGERARFSQYYQFDGFSINTGRTLQFLRDAFVQAGGVIEHRTISPEEARSWDGPLVIAAGERAPEFDTTGAMGDGIYVGGGSIEYAPDIPQEVRDLPAGISGGHMVMLPRIGANGEFTWAVGGGVMKKGELVHPQEADFRDLVADAKSMTQRTIGAWKGQSEEAFTNPRAMRTARRTYNAPDVEMVRRDGNAVMVTGLEGTGWTLAFGLAREAVDMACGRQASLNVQPLLV